jgi:hypothetical protein
VAGSRNPRERTRTKKGEISPALLIEEQKERARLNIQRQERAREAARRREAIHRPTSGSHPPRRISIQTCSKVPGGRGAGGRNNRPDGQRATPGIQESAFEFPRISLLGSWVNKEPLRSGALMSWAANQVPN